MLVERLSNKWIRFLATGEDAKEAFLYVIRWRNASLLGKKVKILAEIVEKCPEIADAISDEDMFSAFEQLRCDSDKRHDILLLIELRWVNQYIRSADVRKKIEKVIYRSMVTFSDYFDPRRREFEWTLSLNEKIEIVKEVLADPEVGNRRKCELAEEFGLPEQLPLRNYFKKLLRDDHFDKAMALEINDPEAVIEVIVDLIDEGAWVIAASTLVQIFLPDRKDIADEISKIERALPKAS